MIANWTISRSRECSVCVAVALAFLPVMAQADIVSNREARYACDGNTQDISGNVRHLSPGYTHL